MIDPFFNHLDRFACLYRGRAGKAAYASAGRFFSTEIGIGFREKFLFHKTNSKTFLSIKP